MREWQAKILSYANEVFAEALGSDDKGKWLQVLLCRGLGGLGSLQLLPPAAGSGTFPEHAGV